MQKALHHLRQCTNSWTPPPPPHFHYKRQTETEKEGIRHNGQAQYSTARGATLHCHCVPLCTAKI